VARNQGVKLGEHSLDAEVDLIKDDTSFHVGVRLKLTAPGA
jgi:osmotically inducible protein OsmC